MYYIPSFLPSFLPSTILSDLTLLVLVADELIYKTVKPEISILNHLIARQCTFVRIYIYIYIYSWCVSWLCTLRTGWKTKTLPSAEAKGWVAGAESRNVTVA